MATIFLEIELQDLFVHPLDHLRGLLSGGDVIFAPVIQFVEQGVFTYYRYSFSKMSSSELLRRLADDFASAIPNIDANAEHDRWQAGIGPFEEERQIEMLRETIVGETSYSIETEVPYVDKGQKVDLYIENQDLGIPVEAKLLRFRYDNGNIDPNSFAKVFSPFPESTTSTLLTDALKLRNAGFEERGGLLGLYYEPVDEPYERMGPETIADKFCLDVNYWYNCEVETKRVSHFKGLQHPVHQQGAVITWEIIE